MAISIYFDGKLIKQLGAYVKTDLSAITQINGVGTGIIGVLGMSETGPDDKVVSINSHAEAIAIYRSGPLVDHIKAMFLGGAGEILALRIGNPTASELVIGDTEGIQVGALDAGNSNTVEEINFRVSSLEKSASSNNLFVSVAVDDRLTEFDDVDDEVILTLYKKNPDCSVEKEEYRFPKVFSRDMVLVKRNGRLFFVQEYQIDNAYQIKSEELNTAIEALTSSQKQDALKTYLQDSLFGSDNVQFFEAGEGIPWGLVLYEVNKGFLFSYLPSRLVRVGTEATPEDILEDPNLFNAEVYQDPTREQEFFSTSLGTYQFVDITKPLTAFTLDNIVAASVFNANLFNNLYALTGGTNGDDGTGYYTNEPQGQFSTDDRATWINGLQMFEEEEVNFIQPAYRFHKSSLLDTRELKFQQISSLVLGHTTLMSQVHMRKRRISLFGYPSPNKAGLVTQEDYLKGSGFTKGAVKTLNGMFGASDRAQAWVSPFQSVVFSDQGDVETLGGEFIASYMAGRHANVEPQISITFTPAAGFGADYLYNWKYVEKDLLISNRVAFIEKIKNAFGAIVYRIHHNPVSWLGPVTLGYQEFILRRIDDFVATYLYKNVEAQFIGRPSFGTKTASQISNFVSTLLDQLLNRQIVAYRNINVTFNSDRTVYEVEFEFQPVTEIKFIPITMKVNFFQ